MRNIISVDYYTKTSTDFSESLIEYSEMPWTFFSEPSNYKNTDIWHEIRRYTTYIKTGFMLFLQRRDIDNIVAWQQFHGIFFSFFCHLFCVRKGPKLVVMTFIYKRKSGLKGLLYENFIKYSLKSDYVDRIVVFTKSEIDHYSTILGISKSKFVYIPLGVQTSTTISLAESIVPCHDYIFSTGRSNRDYNFLISAIRGTKYKLVIACESLKDKSCNNIEILNDCFGNEMQQKMRNSYCVVVTLADKNISAGQLVILQAMQMGKPVIATRTSGLENYITDGINGFLIENTKEELIKVLERLYLEENLYNSISRNARKTFVENHTLKAMGRNVALLVRSINCG